MSKAILTPEQQEFQEYAQRWLAENKATLQSVLLYHVEDQALFAADVLSQLSHPRFQTQPERLSQLLRCGITGGRLRLQTLHENRMQLLRNGRRPVEPSESSARWWRLVRPGPSRMRPVRSSSRITSGAWDCSRCRCGCTARSPPWSRCM